MTGKHPDYNNNLKRDTNVKDPLVPRYFRDTKGSVVQSMGGYINQSMSVVPGSKIISYGAENEQGDPALRASSIMTGSLHAKTIITIGDTIRLSGKDSIISVGIDPGIWGPAFIIADEYLIGTYNTDIRFGFFLTDYDDVLKAGDVIIGDPDSHYMHWDNSAGTLTVNGDVTVTGNINWSQIVDDGNRPENNADVTSAHQSDISASNIVNDEGWTDDTVASSKAKVYRQTTAPSSGMNAGDVWIDTDDGNRPYTYSGSSWVETLTKIDGGRITTGTLDASVVNVVKLSATNITSGTLTGRTVQTSDSTTTQRVVMNGTSNFLQIYDSSRERMRLSQSYLYFYNSGGSTVGQIWSDGTANLFIEAVAAGYLVLKAASSATYGIALYNGTTTIALINSNGIIVQNNLPIYPAGAYGGSVGTSAKPWATMYATTYYFAKSGATTKYIQLNSSSGIDCNANFYVGGTLSKAAGTFTIDHPLKPDTHFLQHSFVESPDMLNIYRGNGEIINGECIIQMPDWFSALNGEIVDDYSYQLTSIGQENNLWVKEETNFGKVIFAGEKDGRFSYIITAIRHDEYAENNRIEVELEKDEEKKQQYKDKLKNK